MPSNFWFEETYDPAGGNQGNTSIRGGQRLVQTFDCDTDDPLATGANVIGALAAYMDVYKGRPHYKYAYAYCTDITAERDEADPAFRWKVRAVYEEPAPVPGANILGVNPDGSPATTPSGTTGGGANQPQPLPWERPGKVGGTFRRQDIYRLKDLSNNKFENPAGDLLDPPIPIGDGVPVLTFTTWKALGDWTPLIGKSFYNTTNTEPWQGFAAYRAVVEGLDFELKTESGLTFWELRWQVSIHDRDMQYERAKNYGWNVIAGGQKVPAKSIYGENLASPVKLALDGTALAPSADPTESTFHVRQAVEFNPVMGVGGL